MTRIQICKIHLLLPILVAGLFCSERMQPVKYMQYYENHCKDYVYTEVRNGYSVSIKYIPAQYFIAAQLVSGVAKDRDSLSKIYNNSLHITITIKSTDQSRDGTFLAGNGSKNEYSKNVLANTFEKTQDIFLYKGIDTVRAECYQYERNWMIGNGDTFTAVFFLGQVKNEIKSYNFVVRDLAHQIGTIDLPLKKIIRNLKRCDGVKL